MKNPVTVPKVPDSTSNGQGPTDDQSQEFFKNSRNGLTPEEPACLMREIGERLKANISLKEMNSMYNIFVKRDLFVDTMVNFLTMVQNLEGVYFTFSTFSNKGVLRLTGISSMHLMKEEQWCLSSMMKLFGGYILSDNSSLTLVFQMKSKFGWD